MDAELMASPPETDGGIRFGDVLLSTVAIFFVAVVFGLPTYFGTRALTTSLHPEDAYLIAVANAGTVGFVGSFLALIGVLWLRGRTWGDLGIRWPSLLWTVAACILGVVVVFARFVILVFLILLLSGPETTETASNGTSHPLVGLAALQLIFIALVMAPLLEELYFRAVLYRWLRGKFGLIVGAGLSSIAFGLAHIEPLIMVSATLLGIVLALSYEWSRSLWIPILIHAVNNLIAIFIIVMVVLLFAI